MQSFCAEVGLARPRTFQRAVLDRCYLQEFKAGTTIYVTGDPPGGMFGLVTGDLGVSIAPGERGPYLAHFFNQGPGSARHRRSRVSRDVSVLRQRGTPNCCTCLCKAFMKLSTAILRPGGSLPSSRSAISTRSSAAVSTL